jgi:TRAP-type C4-dicarboxylate transport system permease small subunit
MRVFARLARGIETLLDSVLFFLFCIMVGSILIQVFARYVLNSPTAWSEELARFLMAAVTMLGSATVIRREGHIAVTVLVDRLPRPLASLIALLRDALVIWMAGSLVYYGIGLTQVAGRQVTTGMEISMAYPYSAIPVGSFFIALMLLLARLTAGTGVRPTREGGR